MKASFSSRKIQLIGVIVLLASIGLMANKFIVQRDVQHQPQKQNNTASGKKVEQPKLSAGDQARIKKQFKDRQKDSPLIFEENRGQASDKNVKFLSRGNGYSLSFGASGSVMTTSKDDGTNFHALKMNVVGADPNAKATGKQPQPSKSNYLLGNDRSKWVTGISHYKEAEFDDVYPGIDLVYYGNHRQYEYDFVVAPGADPTQIKLSFEGAKSMRIDAEGDLVLKTPAGEYRQHKPIVYQEENDMRWNVEGHYVIAKSGEVTFSVGEYDAGKTLVIDPTFTFATYLGGSGAEVVYDSTVGVDSDGNVLITGYTASSDFPTKSALSTTFGGGNTDSFISKFAADGSLVFSTYIGGNLTDQGRGLAVAGGNNPIIVGQTYSSDFPTSSDAYDTSYNGGGDGFVLILDSSGASVVSSTYLGTSAQDISSALVLDSSYNAYIGGVTKGTDFPTTSGAYQTSKTSSNYSAYYLKMDSSLSGLTYSTFMQGASETTENVQGNMVVDSSGYLYFLQYGASDEPVTSGADQTKNAGGYDVFFGKLGTDGTSLVWATYFGGSGNDYPQGMATDSSGNIYIVGGTLSSDLPLTDAFHSSLDYTRDGFVAKYSSDGTRISSSYFGTGSVSAQTGIAIVVDSSDNIFLGTTTSTSGLTTCSGSYAGGNDVYVMGLTSDWIRYYGAYIGGSGAEVLAGLAINTTALYIGGSTASSDLTTSNAHQNSNAGSTDIFVAGLTVSISDTCQADSPTLTSINPDNTDINSSDTTITLTGTGFVSTSVAYFGTTALTTTYSSATELTAVIPSSLLTTAGTYDITVNNPAPWGGTSSAVTFTVNNANLTDVAITISPKSATAGDAATEVTVTGSGFNENSVVNWAGSERTTTYASATKLTFAATAEDLENTGEYAVTVVNPTPGGGTSNSATFTVNAEVPRITALDPNQVKANSDDTTITITGTGFLSTSVAKFEGMEITTSYVSATSLTAVIPSSSLTSTGNKKVTVYNASPGGGTSNEQDFSVYAEPPTLTSIDPNSGTVDDSDTKIFLTGEGFVEESVAYFSDTALTTTYVNATSLTAVIPSTLLADPGTFNVTIVSPDVNGTGGGTSPAQSFTVNSESPILTEISPTTTAAGSEAFTLTVTGAGFSSTSKVKWAGSTRKTTYVSSTELQAAITASDVADGGTFAITVYTPTPGGGTSSSLDFTVTNADLSGVSITIEPSKATVGDAATTVTITGSGFVPSSQAQLDGLDRTTTYVSETELKVEILASDMTAAGTKAVTVVNPKPGGGTSNSATFTIYNGVPKLTKISPSEATVGDSDITTTLTGSNFVDGSTVYYGNTALTTTYVNATKLTAVIPSSNFTASGTAEIKVVTSANGGGESGTRTFTVNNKSTEGTDITVIPTSTQSGSSDTTITITGSNFINGSTAYFDNTALTTTYVSETLLTAVIPSSLLVDAETSALITVVTPTPGGGTSNSVTFTVTGRAPYITKVEADSALVGSSDVTVTITGIGFQSNSTAYLGSTTLTTTYGSSTSLTAVIPASEMTSTGTKLFTVIHPAGRSNEYPFTVYNESPTITSLDPSSATAGSDEITITITGTGYTSFSTVSWNGTTKTSTYVSDTEMTVTIPASDLDTSGTFHVTVIDSGNVSNPGSFIVNAQVPTLTSLSLDSAAAGSSDTTVVLVGTGFNPNSRIRWVDQYVTTTYLSATRLQAVLTTAEHLTTAGTYLITVLNPEPGGGTSNALPFTVYTDSETAPKITSLSPDEVEAGSSATTITITGSNFTSSSVVKWNGAELSGATVNSDTSITITIPAENLTTKGTFHITVATDEGLSNPGTFTVYDSSDRVPTITSLSPSDASAGSDATTVTITGTNFSSSSKVYWNGTELSGATVSDDGTSITITIPSEYLTSEGDFPITVSNDYGISDSAIFTVSKSLSGVDDESPFTLPDGGGDGSSTGNTNIGAGVAAPDLIMTTTTSGSASTYTADSVISTGNAVPYSLQGQSLLAKGSLPTTLGGLSINVTDSTGASYPAGIISASSKEINWVVPSQCADGPATVMYSYNGASIRSKPITIQRTAPGIFTATPGGSGLPVAMLLRIKKDGSELLEGLSSSINLDSSKDQVFLALCGTGFRHNTGAVTATINGQAVKVYYSGATATHPGLDQVNLLIPNSMRGKGDVPVVVSFGGTAANTVTINIK